MYKDKKNSEILRYNKTLSFVLNEKKNKAKNNIAKELSIRSNIGNKKYRCLFKIL